MRAIQPQGTRGSLKWIQALVNQRSDLLNRLVRENCRLESDEAIEWVSPLRMTSTQSTEMIRLSGSIGVELRRLAAPRVLAPVRASVGRIGPHRLGRTVLLVEAKANIPELRISRQRRKIPGVNIADRR